MKQGVVAVIAAMLAAGASAAWYWPFGYDDDNERPRVSKLTEKASEMMDTAAELSADGKYEEAILTNQAALAELERIESENPERAATSEFATVRNKRAIISAAIDSLYLRQARENAKAVAVTDTTALEERIRKESAPIAGTDAIATAGAKMTRTSAAVKEASAKYADGEYAAGAEILARHLNADPADVKALNLKAMCEVADGKIETAKKTLVAAIAACPDDYRASYNMAYLLIKTGADADEIDKYYKRGRAVGGPQDARIEEALK